MDKLKRQRNITIDYIRAFSMCLIVLAHVDPPEIVRQIRSFDVVCLVAISIMCMSPIVSRKEYVYKLGLRIRRLLVPTYICIVAVLAGTYIMSIFFKVPYGYDLKSIITSFLLIDGIGYVWIVRVLLIQYLISPILFKVSSMKDGIVYSLSITMMLISLYINNNMPDDRILYHLLFYFVLPTIGYGVIGIVALKLKNYNKQKLSKFIIAGFSSLFIYKTVNTLINGDSLISFTKHPPMIDWVIYGLVVTAVWLLVWNNDKVLPDSTVSKCAVWVSVNSFRIYFAHIYVIKTVDFVEQYIYSGFITNWIVRYLFVCFCSIALVLIYGIIEKRIGRVRKKILKR